MLSRARAVPVALRGLIIAMFAVSLPSSMSLAAGQKDSGNLDIEFSEAKLTLDAVTTENQALHRQVDEARAQLRAVTESLAISNSEAEVFRRQCGELKMRLEALGLDAGGDKGKLEQRLLKAVSDLRLAQSDKDRLAEQLLRLSETIVRFVKSAVTTNADARMQVEQQMRATSEVLGVKPQAVEAAPVPATLTDGMVISVKEEFALVVANLGSTQGVRMGMPFQVWRGDNRIALVRVVDVREKIAGAVIQDLSDKQKIRVGDRLRVDAR